MYLRLLAFLAGLLLAAPQALAVNTNPIPGSVWTWLGPTYGADWGPNLSAGSYVNAVSAYGADPRGLIDNAAVFANIFSSTGSETFFFPPGTYRVSCGHTFSAASAISLLGSGRSQTTIKLDPGCVIPYDLGAPGTGMFLWGNKSGVSIRNLTFDMNSPAVPTSTSAPIQFYTTSGTATGFRFENAAIINGVAPTVLLYVANKVGVIDQPIIRDSYFSLATAATSQNQCIALYTYQGLGTITRPIVDSNTCVNTGIEFDGSNGFVTRNNVSGFKFGQGIFTLFSLASQPSLSCHDAVIAENIIHDSPNTIDINGVPAGGFEVNCPHSLVANNLVHDLGGQGFVNFADETTYIGNTAYNNGGAFASCSVGYCDGIPTGIFLYSSVGASMQANSRNVTMIGNTFYDAGAGTQKYALVINALNFDTTPNAVQLRGNNFTGTIQALKIADGPAGLIHSDAGYINAASTVQLTSGLPSFMWTALDTASYHRWRLYCENLASGSTTKIRIQVGEGSGPTWKTAGSYVVNALTSTTTSGAPGVYNNGSDTGIPISGIDTILTGGGYPSVFEARIGDLAYPNTVAAYKPISWTGSYGPSPSGLNTISGVGVWQGDTAPITALRVIADAGNVFGSCSLEGTP